IALPHWACSGARLSIRPRASLMPKPAGWRRGNPVLRLLAVAAQPLEIDDRHAAIFEPQQTLLFQPLQALVCVLPGDPGQRADFLLRNLQVTRQVGVEDWIEQ